MAPRQVYRAACHYSDSEHETDIALQITSSRAFNRIMLFTLREACLLRLHPSEVALCPTQAVFAVASPLSDSC
jgi:hypothetical protein